MSSIPSGALETCADDEETGAVSRVPPEVRLYGSSGAERSWNERWEISTLTCVKPCAFNMSRSFGALDSSASRVTALCVLIAI